MTASSSVTVGIHLPQAGPAASGEALRQAAALAEQLGFRDVWLSDHLLVPTGADYVGDGWHGGFLEPEQTKRIVARLRLARPDPDFVISMRTRRDPMADNHDQILSEFDALREAGVTHFVPEPRQRTLADYLRSIESLSELMKRAGASLDLLAE